MTKARWITKHHVPANKPITSCLWHSTVPAHPFSKGMVGKQRDLYLRETMKYDEKVVVLVLDMKDLNNSEWEQRVLYMLFSALLLVFSVGGLGLVLSVFTVKTEVSCFVVARTWSLLPSPG